MSKFHMSKSSLLLSLAVIFLGSGVLVYTETEDRTFLKKFRRSDASFPVGTQNAPSRVGLGDLNISGSSRFTPTAFKRQLLDKIDVPVYVMDLQSEPHYFINGLPEHWYGYDRSEKLSQGLKGVKVKYLLRRLIKTGKLTHGPEDIKNEQQVIEGMDNVHYANISQVRHTTPEDDGVDNFIAAVNSVPHGYWMHFHCSAGQGRTTISLAMVDILKNGRKVPLEDIIKRQHLIGGEDLFDTRIWSKSTYTQEMLDNRKNFIIKFYDFVNDPQGYGTISWTEWNRKRV